MPPLDCLTACLSAGKAAAGAIRIAAPFGPAADAAPAIGRLPVPPPAIRTGDGHILKILTRLRLAGVILRN